MTSSPCEVGVMSCLLVLLDMRRRAARDCPELSSGDRRTDSPIPKALSYKCFDLIVGSGNGGKGIFEENPRRQDQKG
ncbi:hypothetical protein DL96DRAFT_524936 [Flagelloscypha sp. PMI_526]|nr:hypothetical protein DL96DRAFT_524936 [Flagelloscypha sp. PMI_526]